MTAEIVIMNRGAVAVAADSAITLTVGPGNVPQKIFTSAQKIFELAGKQPVCFMIFNNAAFMGIPWSTVISIYRRNLGEKTFPTLGEYLDDFIEFLRSKEDFIPKEVEENAFVARVYGYFLFLRSLIQQQANQQIQQKGGIKGEDVLEITKGIIEKAHKDLTDAPFAPGMDEKAQKMLLDQFRDPINKAMQEVFQNLPLDDTLANALGEIPILYFVKAVGPYDPLWGEMSGLVIIGFGENDLFPSVRYLILEGKVGPYLKQSAAQGQEVTFENGAAIVPFAQREVVDLFLSGMDPRFEEALLTSLGGALQDFLNQIISSMEGITEKEKKNLKSKYTMAGGDILQKVKGQLDNYRAYNVNPVINVVSGLPKSDMAELAESLVNLTSLRRRVSLTAETVGGPVDVALISKEEGFIWYRRKHTRREEVPFYPGQIEVW